MNLLPLADWESIVKKRKRMTKYFQLLCSFGFNLKYFCDFLWTKQLLGRYIKQFKICHINGTPCKSQHTTHDVVLESPTLQLPASSWLQKCVCWSKKSQQKHSMAIKMLWVHILACSTRQQETSSSEKGPSMFFQPSPSAILSSP